MTQRFLPFMTLVFAAGVQAAEQAPLLAELQDQSRVRGCAWLASATSLGNGYMFIAEYDDSAAWMNIGGSDTQLAFIAERGSLKRVGDVLERSYRAPGVEVLARYSATWVCPADGEESCEVTRYAVMFEVATPDRIQIVDGAGAVGC